MRDDKHPFYPSRDPDDGLREDRLRFLRSAAVTLGRPSLFYASLRDSRIFEIVVGRPLDACDREEVRLTGLRLGMIKAGTGFPGLFPDDEPRDGALSCLAVHDLSDFERTMIAWYEWDEYVLRPVSLEDGRVAQAFVPDREAIRNEYGEFRIEDWSFEAWQTQNIETAATVARDWMSRRPGDDELIGAGFFSASQASAARRAAG